MRRLHLVAFKQGWNLNVSDWLVAPFFMRLQRRTWAEPGCALRVAANQRVSLISLVSLLLQYRGTPYNQRRVQTLWKPAKAFHKVRTPAEGDEPDDWN